MRKVVVNTTPLIALANIGQLELLREPYGEVFIPDAVMEEIRSEPARSLVKDANWIKQCTIVHPEQKMLYKARLHAGEVEVMILAQEESADLVIMDDNTAKATAKFFGFSVTGTLGILVKAKQRGMINEVSSLLCRLVGDGFYVDEKTKEMVLKQAGEF